VTRVVTAAASSKSGFAGYFELVDMPTEDYPGPTKSHPEKEDTNHPPRPAKVDPERPALPTQQESPLEEEEEEE
jgi:hypothetical protein